MPQLLRLRFVSVGHPQARMDDLLLDFEGPDGQAIDSTLWLRNGGGKSSILNLFFAIVRPHKGEFLGGKADAKQRSLNDYVLAGDRAVAVAEWQLDPSSDSLGFESERFITGVFYERREGSGDLRRLFFSCKADAAHPHSTLEHLPLFKAGRGATARHTFGAFRETWRSLRDAAPHLGVADTENQREWQEVLEAARIDPELFSYQVLMNQREGGADELFRFAESEDFVDFLLALAMDPALGDRVGKNIAAFRRELLQRKEQLIPERELVTGLLERLGVVRDIGARRIQLREELGDVREDLTNLQQLGAQRLAELAKEAQDLEAQSAAHAAAARQKSAQSQEKRARAAQLRRHAADLRLARLRDEHDQVQQQWKAAQQLAKIWNAAVPLRRALHFEEKAREQRRLVQRRESDHAPLRAELEEAAHRLACALSWRAQQYRKGATDAKESEKAAREEALEYRRQVAESGKVQTRAESKILELEGRLASVEARRQQLVRDNLLDSGEPPGAGLARWTAAASDHEDSVARLYAEILRLDESLEALEGLIATAGGLLAERRSHVENLNGQFKRATREREAIENDEVLMVALELESIDGDRIGDDAVHTLEQAARNAQRSVVEARLSVADDERAVLHLEEHGLLPPSPDAQRVLEFLSGRLGGQAWSGWSWIEANVPRNEARAVIQTVPSLAQGVIVRPADLERAAALLQEADIQPEGPLLVAGTDALAGAANTIGLVVGPKESAWFDRGVAQIRLSELRGRVDEHQQRIATAESRYRELMRSREALRSFRARYPVGWFDTTARDLEEAEERSRKAQENLRDLHDERRENAARRKELEAESRRQERNLKSAQVAMLRLKGFVDDYVEPSAAWNAELEDNKAKARRALEEVQQWGELADDADRRATSAANDALKEGEEARVVEVELSAVDYLEAETVAMAGPTSELRDRYHLLRNQYEEKVGADALLALAKQNDENAREERARLAKLVSPEATEEIVREHLAELDEPDTVEQLRQDAETRASSLLGKMGNLKGRIDPAAQALQEATERCDNFVLIPSLKRPPTSPEMAEAEATTHENEAKLCESDASLEEQQADDAKKGVEQAKQRRAEIDRQMEKLQSLREDYADLLTAGVNREEPSLPGTLEESTLIASIKRRSDDLRKCRGTWQALDGERGAATATLRTFAAEPAFERLNAPWLRRLQEHDEPALEAASEQLCEHLELRLRVLDEQIAGVDRHRNMLVDELHAVADDGLKLLRQASNLSKLPDHLPGIGGAHFLRIQTHEPDDPAERRARLAELIDELLDGRSDFGGVALVQAAVRRLARPVQVRVLHPDPALDRRTVSIPEMARSSGGEQLTGAILLYCTLARVRGRSRGLSRRSSSVLILDNPIGRASRVRFLELQRDVARAMGVQLIYTTGVNDYEALRALPNIIRLRNERVDRNSGRRLVELAPGESGLVEAVRIGRREEPASDPSQNSEP